MFDPKAHLIQLPRRVKDQATGQWVTRLDEYLEVKWRLVWFRERYPHGSIATEAVMLDWEKGIAIYKATVGDGEGGVATGTGTETRKSFEDFVEKSETRAIGRALAALGIGTQFVGEEMSEGEHVADAPVSSSNGCNVTVASPAEPETPHHVPEPAQEHLTQGAIDRLFELATATNEPKEALGSRLRNLMRLSGDTPINKKFLREQMTQAQYDAARAYYERVIREQVEDDVPTHEPPAPARQDDPEATQPPSGDTVAVTPEGAPAAAPPVAGSLSATDEPTPVDDPLEQDRAIVRALALGWGLPESEVDHVLNHHRDPQKAKNILWSARLQRTRQPSPQLNLAGSAA
jgi:hypothetical protein